MNQEPIETDEAMARVLFSKEEIIEAIEIVLAKVKDKQGYKGLCHSLALQSVTDSFRFQMYKQLKLKG